MTILWESSHRAKHSYHTCDLCGEWIQQGQRYTRQVLSLGGKGLVVVRIHEIPDCPKRDEPEREAYVGLVVFKQAA